MIDSLLKLDSYVFQFINSNLSNPIFDIVFVFFDKPFDHFWFCILLPLSIVFYIDNHKNKKKALLIIIFLIVGALITNQIGSVIKNFEFRKRPYITEKHVNIPDGINHIKKDANNNYKETKSSKKSFPSNHSANIFFISFFLSYVYSNKKKYFITLAILVAISRVYIGAHYPIDIISGAILGIIVNYIIMKLLNKLGINLATYHQEV